MSKYENILQKLAEEECIASEFSYAAYCHEFTKERGDIFYIEKNGTFCGGCNDYSAEQINAIANACKKIAANYQAEHGKEGA